VIFTKKFADIVMSRVSAARGVTLLPMTIRLDCHPVKQRRPLA
jgi:hypothetical protein